MILKHASSPILSPKEGPIVAENAGDEITKAVNALVPSITNSRQGILKDRGSERSSGLRRQSVDFRVDDEVQNINSNEKKVVDLKAVDLNHK
jgi:hypothetical protein